MKSYLVSAAAAGLCLAAGWHTIKAGNSVLGYVIWLIGVVNLWLMQKQMKEDGCNSSLGIYYCIH